MSQIPIRESNQVFITSHLAPITTQHLSLSLSAGSALLVHLRDLKKKSFRLLGWRVMTRSGTLMPESHFLLSLLTRENYRSVLFISKHERAGRNITDRHRPERDEMIEINDCHNPPRFIFQIYFLTYSYQYRRSKSRAQSFFSNLFNRQHILIKK